MSDFEIQALNSEQHHREEFSCESQELTLFLRERARKEMAANASVCFVLVPTGQPGRVAGYYTLSSAEIALTDLPANLAKKLPRYEHLPAILLGRLARDSAFRGKGIGDLLMLDALARAWKISREMGSVAVITDPKDAKAAKFYEEFNFQPLTAKRLYLPIKEVERLLDSRKK